MTTALAETTTSRNPLVNAARSWNQFWFNTADPTLLGLIRICCGLVTLYIHVAYCADLQELFGKNAWVDQTALHYFRTELPWATYPDDWFDDEDQMDQQGMESNVAAQGYVGSSIWYHLTDPRWMAVVHGCVLVVIFMFTIGLFTRITSVLTWIAALGYIQREPTALFGVDTMMNILLLYLAIGPSGATLSVDRLFRRYWASWRALHAHRPAPTFQPPAPSVSANFALRLIQFHLCVIYLVAGMSKLKGDAWWQGTAIHYTVANPEFSPMNWAPFMQSLVFICQHLWLWAILMIGSVAFTFFVEIGFPFLVWNPRMRWTMIISATLMHLGIIMTMGLTTFSLMMICMVLAFVPPEALNRLLRRLGGQLAHMRLVFDSYARPQVRIASLVHAFDAWDQVDLVDAGAPRNRTNSVETERPHLQLDTANHENLFGYPLFERLVRSLRLLWPLALLTFIPGVSTWGRGRFTGNHPSSNLRNRKPEKQPATGEKVTTL